MEITEDYVSLETALLLKKAGFNVPVRTFYNPKYKGKKVSDGTALINYNADPEDNSILCSAPTVQMARKWLREVHGLFINLFIYEYGEGKVAFEIEKIPSAETVKEDYEYATYEEAAEAAIKYCLTNIIK